MVGAIEFLRKAKAICESITNEADLVRKVVEYRLEDGDAERD